MESDLALPEGWASVRIDEVTEVNPGKPPKDLLPADAPVSFVPMPAVDAERGAITEPEVRPYHQVRNGFTAFKDDDLIVAKITPCMENGKAAVARDLVNGWGFGSSEFHVLRSHGAVLPEYLYHFVRQQTFRDDAAKQMTGSVGQKRVPADFIKKSIIPLPPLAEQRRIVAQLEALLADAERVRGRLEAVEATMQRFRQAVLVAACDGWLTEDWRSQEISFPNLHAEITKKPERKKENQKQRGRFWGAGEIRGLSDAEKNRIPTTWSWEKVRDLGDSPEETVQIGPMSMQSRLFTENGVPVLNVGCVQQGSFDESKLDYLPEEIALTFSRYRIRTDDIIFTRSGTVGRCAIATVRQNHYLMTFHLLRVRVNRQHCLPQYLLFVFQGARHIRAQIEQGAIGSTRAGFNTRLLAGLDIPLPPLPEQHEIVRRVDALFALAGTIEGEVAAALERVEALTQAVLAKAFRGELVPTEAELARREGREYEPASALLERVRAERQPGRPKPPGRARRPVGQTVLPVE